MTFALDGTNIYLGDTVVAIPGYAVLYAWAHIYSPLVTRS